MCYLVWTLEGRWRNTVHCSQLQLSYLAEPPLSDWSVVLFTSEHQRYTVALNCA